MKIKPLLFLTVVTLLTACNTDMGQKKIAEDSFNYDEVDRFADIRILRYQVAGFDTLSLQQKKLLYYLSEAALCGRDIIFDQFGKYNLAIRRVLEGIYKSYQGDRQNPEFKAFEDYLKRVWFSNGIHHHYSGDKFDPGFSQQYFEYLVSNSDYALFPSIEGVDEKELIRKIIPVIFDASLYPKKVAQKEGTDMVALSSVNFYEGVTQAEVEQFYGALRDESDLTPVSHGLNSKLLKVDGQVVEKVYKIDGMYGQAIEKIVHWLEKAIDVAETPGQKVSLEKLVSYYKSGSLKTWDEYNIAWVNDLHSLVDVINGFVEVYNDPMGMKATWESVVNFKHTLATKRTETISENAQWFEDHSPIDPRFKKKEVKGVTAKVINAVQLGGDCYPATPIGINLPNADWIRRDHGSKSVTIQNITESYYKSSLKSGFYEEFLYDAEELRLIREYGFLTDNLHTDLHECLGHGSGQLLPGITTDALKNYHSALEETRADLFALYYMYDPRMVELGLLPNHEAAKAQYIDYIQNGIMTQLKRVDLGKNIEQAHMRCRQLISKWCYEKGQSGNVIEKLQQDGKTYYKINDFDALRNLFAELLKEVQRIKSEGDFEAGWALVETYAVKVDYDLHKEVKERYDRLNMPPYVGFLNPVLKPVIKRGEIVDVKIGYIDDYVGQMLYYSDKYSFLSSKN